MALRGMIWLAPTKARFWRGVPSQKDIPFSIKVQNSLLSASAQKAGRKHEPYQNRSPRLFHRFLEKRPSREIPCPISMRKTVKIRPATRPKWDDHPPLGRSRVWNVCGEDQSMASSPDGGFFRRADLGLETKRCPILPKTVPGSRLFCSEPAEL